MMNNLSSSSIYKHKRHEKGLCISCGKTLNDGSSKYECKECKEKKNKYMRDTRAWYASMGICPRCCKNDLFGSEKSCPECRAKAANNALKRRATQQGKEKYNMAQREMHKSIYQIRKEQGLCTRCGKRKADINYFTCKLCREKGNDKRRIGNYGNTKSDEVCRFCNEPVLKGYKVCKVHYDKLCNLSHICTEKKEKAKRDFINHVGYYC